MEFKEFMNNENLSESDIVKAARIVNELCRSLSACKLCPLYSGSRCIATKTGGVSIVGIVKERMKKLLNPNRMDKVAELLGVKLGEKFIVDTGEDGNLEYILGEDGLHYVSLNFKDTFPELLQDLLTGKAYIVKKEKKDE